ncbi:MAG: RNA polymerase sigma factor [Cytophagales bacterium]|nr:RNA polymerase sigma factor [Cytophagales bacterium]
MNQELERYVAQAIAGDKQALEQVLLGVKDLIYNLSVKMLLFPEDAEDATQEILIKLVTRLSTFRGQSQFTTWVYRVASNYLLTIKGKKSREFSMDFEQYAHFIDMGQSHQVRAASNAGELLLLEEEVKVSCTQGLLLCLDPPHRLTYILGDILEFPGKEGARVLSIAPETFRQQLSRSRKKIRNFLRHKCGLINPSNPCRCLKKVDFLANQGLINTSELRFAKFKERSIDLMETIEAMEKETAVYRSNPNLQAPESITANLKRLLRNAN